jgi:hypothetical protein
VLDQALGEDEQEAGQGEKDNGGTEPSGKETRRPSARMSCIEKWRAEIVVCVVLPISLLLWTFRTVKRAATYPSPALHGARVLRVSQEVARQAQGVAEEAAAAAEGGTRGAGKEPSAAKPAARMLRTDRSVFESHSVRNSNKTGSRLIGLGDLRAILGVERAELAVGESVILHCHRLSLTVVPQGFA